VLLLLLPPLPRLHVLPLQAAGRLRQLGGGQRLVVMGLPDVTDKIRAAAAYTLRSSSSKEPSMLQLLQWTMDSTVKGSQAGVAEWASQGCHFAATKGAPELALQPEKLQLDELYGVSRAPEPVGQVLSAIAARHKQLCSSSGAALSPDALSRITQIEQKGQQLGQGYSVIADRGLSEEVERELQEEEEQEEEVEVQPPLVTPAAENDWQYIAVLQPGVTSLKQLRSKAGSLFSVMQLSEVPNLLLEGAGLSSIPWSSKVYCSANFVCTTAASQRRVRSSSSTAGGGDGMTVGAAGGLSEYLRPLDALLVFPSSGEVLLLSEREADSLQEELWRAAASGSSSSSGAPVLMNLAYARFAADEGPAGAQQRLLLASPVKSAAAARQLSTQVSCKRMRMDELQLGTAELVSMLLFNGSTSYAAHAAAADDARQAGCGRGAAGFEGQGSNAGPQRLGVGM
jgi:hypothetical protein